MKVNFLLLLIIIITLPLCKKKEQVSLPDSGSGPAPVDGRKGSKYFFNLKNVYFEVDTASGGRISSVKAGGDELLYLNSTTINWGSTFWPSPQSQWSWPPPASLDNKPYTVKRNGDTLTMQSQVATDVHLSLRKIFYPFGTDTSVVVTYSLKNEASASQTWAPWEITRVPSGGIAFFPKGTTAPTGILASQVKDSLGILWLDYDSTAIPASGTPKLFADGSEGWLAYVGNNRVLLVRKFQDVPPDSAAPGEAEIELYTDPAKNYIEVEAQGAYAAISAGTTRSWTVKWYIRKLPDSIPLSINEDLMNYVRNVIK